MRNLPSAGLSSEVSVISNIYFGHHLETEISDSINTCPTPQIDVSWAQPQLLMFNLRAHNKAQEPIAVDIRLYMAFFCTDKEPPPPQDRIKIALSLGTKMIWAGQVLPDASMCPEGLWMSGPSALKLPPGTKFVQLVAKIDKPQARADLPWQELDKCQHLATWSGKATSPREDPCD